jgi:2-phospho-L-lactate guanylyltransferase
MEAWAVVHADLPLLTPQDLDAIRHAAGAGGRIVLSPSHNGGTSAIAGSTPTFPFRYGPGSFRRHLATVGGDVRVVVRRGLAVDVDQPGDLAAARRLGALP